MPTIAPVFRYKCTNSVKLVCTRVLRGHDKMPPTLNTYHSLYQLVITNLVVILLEMGDHLYTSIIHLMGYSSGVTMGTWTLELARPSKVPPQGIRRYAPKQLPPLMTVSTLFPPSSFFTFTCCRFVYFHSHKSIFFYPPTKRVIRQPALTQVAHAFQVSMSWHTLNDL